VAGDEVLTLGSVDYQRDGEYHEHRPAAWLVTVSRGRILRSLGFDSWEAARNAAGFDAKSAREIKLDSGVTFA
jgi:hypothetical protein